MRLKLWQLIQCGYGGGRYRNPDDILDDLTWSEIDELLAADDLMSWTARKDYQIEMMGVLALYLNRLNKGDRPFDRFQAPKKYRKEPEQTEEDQIEVWRALMRSQSNKSISEAD